MSNPGFNFETGNFTQVVWKGSTEFGIGAAVSADNSIYVCDNYFPLGNWGNDFEENVAKKLTDNVYYRQNHLLPVIMILIVIPKKIM